MEEEREKGEKEGEKEGGRREREELRRRAEE